MFDISILVVLFGLTLGVDVAPPDDHPLEDFQFSVDPAALQGNEMAANIREISKAVMGIAELVVEIRSELRREGGSSGRVGKNTETIMLEDPERVKKNHELANKLEKLFGPDVDPKLVEKTKEELKKTMEINFIRVLSAMLISGPIQSEERKGDILRLMRSVLNGELDFGPVVERLPFIMRDSETKQFIHLLNALKEGEDKKKKFRQSDSDEDEDADTEDKPPVQQAYFLKAPPATILQQAVRPQLLQQIGEVPVSRPQPQQLKAVGAPVPVAPAAPARPAPLQAQQLPLQTQLALQSQLAQLQQQPAAAAPVPIILQLPQQAAAPTPAPKTGLQKFIEAMNSININQLTEFFLKLPELFQGVEGLIDGIGFIE